MSTNFLYKSYPILRETVPHVELGNWPTPLEPLPGISAQPLLLVKRDDLSHPLYGGNKVRKLELILADVKRKGFREIITAGGWAPITFWPLPPWDGSWGCAQPASSFASPLTSTC